jgi:hypothetical protein
MKYAGLILVLLLVFTSGCGPTIVQGKRVEVSQRSDLIKGQTTVDKAVEILGQPASIEKLPTGGEKYVYQYYKEEFTHWWTLPRYERQRLEVFFKNGIVQDYVYTRESRNPFLSGFSKL